MTVLLCAEIADRQDDTDIQGPFGSCHLFGLLSISLTFGRGAHHWILGQVHPSVGCRGKYSCAPELRYSASSLIVPIALGSPVVRRVSKPQPASTHGLCQVAAGAI